MTLQSEITAMGYPNTTDIDNAVTEALDQLSNFYGSTLAEGTDSKWDRITKALAVHLLDRRVMVVRSFNDPTVSVPPLIPDNIMAMIKDLMAMATIGTTPESKIHFTFTPPDTSNDEKWSEPLN